MKELVREIRKIPDLDLKNERKWSKESQAHLLPILYPESSLGQVKGGRRLRITADGGSCSPRY